MEPTRYIRNDFVIRLARTPQGTRLQFGPREHERTLTLDDSLLGRLLIGDRPAETYHPITTAFTEWTESSRVEEGAIRRLCLHLDDPLFQGLTFHQFLGWRVHEPAKLILVRMRTERPTVLGLPLAPPIRILHVANDGPDLWEQLQQSPDGLQGGPERYSHVLEIERETSRDFRRRLSEPSARPRSAHHADIIVFSEHTYYLHWFDERPDSFVRHLEKLGTRLMVATRRYRPDIEHLSNPHNMPAAVFGIHEDHIGLFLLDIIHDKPIDIALSRLPIDPRDYYPAPLMIGGGGREEITRVSHLAERLQQVSRQGPRLLTESLRAGVQAELDTVAQQRLQWRFDDREQSGLIPMSEALKPLVAAHRAERNREARAPRFILADLRSMADQETPARLLPTTPEHQIRTGKKVQLGITVGPQADNVATLDARELLDSLVQWKEDQTGVWLDVAVVPLDFVLHDPPLRPLWLPREGASTPVFFALSPRRSGVSAVRYILYQGNHILQSGRLAAHILDDSEERPQIATEKLARALNYRRAPHKLQGRWYASRPEYGPPRIEITEETREPQLSIVANRHAETPIVSVKLGDHYAEVDPNADIFTFTNDLRREIDGYMSATKYQFNELSSLGKNAATSAVYASCLHKLARIGWELYNQIFSAQTRELIAREVTPGARLEIAQLVLEEGIPWAFLYDREYDPPPNQPVIACEASLDQGPSLPEHCGEHPSCPLHADRVNAAKAAGQPIPTEETVACPWRLWGFRHDLAMPPKHFRDKNTGSPPSEIAVTGVPVAVWGVHTQMPLAPAHVTSLRGLQSRNLVRWDPQQPLEERSPLKEYIKTSEGPILYIYCHVEPTPRAPRLMVWKTLQHGIAPADINRAAVKNRLVILNGCDTAASPQTLGPFVLKFVRDHEAAGVLGTEAKVREVLADEAACLFLESFLSQKSAGEALKHLRYSLLRRRNPFGLIYTLHAEPDLHLVITPP